MGNTDSSDLNLTGEEWQEWMNMAIYQVSRETHRLDGVRYECDGQGLKRRVSRPSILKL